MPSIKLSSFLSPFREPASNQVGITFSASTSKWGAGKEIFDITNSTGTSKSCKCNILRTSHLILKHLVSAKMQQPEVSALNAIF
jgi:hypothetical protein